ncbi:ankyrin repeat-containing domain protein [Xylaria longipes]|nr:ankyrin repeat-containing domain protein [Xylaria longipes]
MEAAGLSVGVIGLVSLFGTCLDMLERWDAYKDFGFESGSIRARFIADRVRFREWGRRVGISQGKPENDYHPALKNLSVRSAVDIVLHSVKKIDDDAKKYASHLGNLSDPVGLLPKNDDIVPSGHIHIGKMENTPSRRDRLGWAFRGKARALALVGSFEILVQKLYDLVPPDETNVESRVAVVGQSEETALVEDAGAWRDDVQRALLDLEKQIYNETRREIRDWLDGLDMKRTYDDFILKILDGTCDWILSRPEFHQWQSFAPGNPKILWINGPPGYGKTILCARLIEYMSATSRTYVSYFFFSSEIESRANPFVVMRSWIAQLITQAQEALSMTREKREATDGRTASQCAMTGNTTDPDHKRYLIEFLEFLTNAISESKSRLLIVSRNDLRIREGLRLNDIVKRELAELQISPEDVQVDASAFSRSIVRQKLSNKSEAQQEALASRLVNRCESMFLAIKLLDDDLRGGKNLKQLQRAIDEAPNKLDHIYDRNWERIQHLENSSRRRAFSILRWATFAQRPLTILEITECLLIPEREDDEIDYEELPDSIDEIYVKTEILELCSSLIEIRAEPNSTLGGSTVHLTHFSVKQYILSHMLPDISELAANEQLRSSNEAIQRNLLAKYCLRYLNYDQTWNRAPSEVNGSTIIHAFREYSAKLWWLQVERGVSNSKELFRLINAFFWPPNSRWESWRRTYNSFSIKIPWVIYDEIRQEVGNPLLYASLFQLTETVDHLINEVGLEVDHVYSPSRSLLAKPLMEYEPGTTQPLGKLANSNTGNQLGVSPLHLASFSGNVGIMKLLLQAGADPELQMKSGWASLHLASYHGHNEVARLLLEEGARIDVLQQDGFSPLSLSAGRGHTQVVKLLLENGAEINEVNNNGWTPLALACRNGHTDIVQLLLENGAKLNEVDGDRTPLALACRYGHTDVARLLLENGADACIATRNGYTPLALASTHSHVDIVRLLLENGADTCVVATNGTAPLSSASLKGHVEIVKLLLDNGADSNVTTRYGRTALSEAAQLGYIDVVKLFLEYGHSVESLGPSGRSLLSYAVGAGHYELAEYLLQRGASPNSKAVVGRSPLFYAALSGHVAVFDLILSKSIDGVNSRDVHGSAILSLAVRHGHVDLVSRLLSHHEIDLNSRDNFGRLVSFWANTPRILRSITEAATRRGIALEIPDSTAPTRSPETSSTMSCDVCTLRITRQGDYYHCGICAGGDFDICEDCYVLGASCLGDTHELVKKVAVFN